MNATGTKDPIFRPSRLTQSRRPRGLSWLLAAALVVGAAGSALADPPAWEVPDEQGAFGRGNPDGPGAELRQSLRLHMQLGHFYLLDGDYQSALDHFLAVSSFEVPAEILAEHPRAGERGSPQKAHAYLMAAVASELMGNRDGAIALAEAGQEALPEAGEWDGRRGRRGATGDRRGRRGQRAGLSGDTDGDSDDAVADDAPGRRGRPGARRGGRGGQGRLGPRVGPALEQFIADPAAFAERFAGGVEGLEDRLLELEAGLTENDE